jgi:hypothetical protein
LASDGEADVRKIEPSGQRQWQCPVVDTVIVTPALRARLAKVRNSRGMLLNPTGCGVPFVFAMGHSFLETVSTGCGLRPTSACG